MTRPQFPHTVKPVPTSSWGCRVWLRTGGLPYFSVHSAFCISAYKSPRTKPAENSKSQQCKRRGVSRELVFSFTVLREQKAFPGGRRAPHSGARVLLPCSIPQPSPSRSKPGSLGPKPSFPPGMAVHTSGLVAHLLSQLDTDAQLDPLQLGCLPAWALKSCAGGCPPLPLPAFGFYGFGDVPEKR